MAIIIDTTTIPGTTIIYDDELGGIYAIPPATEFPEFPTFPDNSEILERIATALESIADDVSRLRDLADHPNGLGIRTAGTTAYNNIEKATLYKSLVLEGGILTYNRESADRNIGSTLNPPEGIEQIAVDRINELSSGYDQIIGGIPPA